jgi:hypothetical protein
LPGFISMQWMVEPTGIERSGRQLPGLIGESEPDTRRSPTATPFGAMM